MSHPRVVLGLSLALAAGTVLIGQVPAGAAAAPVAALGTAAAVDDATASLWGMTLEQRVGQVFMVGGPATGVPAATVSAVRDRHVGSVMLTGRSTAGVGPTAGVTNGVRALVTAASTAGTGLLVATDQEGSRVQVLQGPGFSAIPSGLAQGTLDPGVLRGRAAQWGRELRAAGVDTDLAPVLDTVPSPAAAATNPPIGALDREYGYTPATVAAHGTAFAQGMADAGVAATVKHFPGLGRVTGNTDTTSGVTDRVTTRTDAYLTPFATALRAGAPMLMMSTAYYALLDPAHPAAFSGAIIGGMVRGDLGFDGVVISDDLAQAQQVAAWSYGDRALQFLGAGGDLVLTVQPGTLPAMYDAVLAQARADAGFRARVEQAALRVLRLKQAKGLLPRGGLGAIGFTYQALGGPGSFLGQPLTPQYPVAGGVEQDFAGGEILWSPATGPHVVHGAVLYAYRLNGGPAGPLGLPTTDELAAPDGAGRYNDFSGGPGGPASVYWSAATGPHAVRGAVRARWASLGLTTGPLGYPTTDELGAPDGVGRFNDFAGRSGTASVYWSPGTGVAAVYGAIRGHWAALGLTTGPLGYPTTDELGGSDGVGRFNAFRGRAGGGVIWWTPRTGAHAVYGAILDGWARAGGPEGRLGYPVADEADAPGGRVSVFEHGRITWRAADNTLSITYT